MTEPNRQPANRDKSQCALGLLLTFPQAWGWWKLVLVHNTTFSICTQAQKKKKNTHTVDHFVALNKACHRSSLILNYARVPPKRPQNQ